MDGGSLGGCQKIAFRKMVWSSFKWLLAMDSAWIWNLSIVFK
jgi:hypothetical protein